MTLGQPLGDAEPRFVYFDALDSALTAPTQSPERRRIATVSATGSVMLAMLIGGVTPVLSAEQAYDNADVLQLVARGDANSAAFLRLVAAGQIQVRLRASDGQEPSLLNAFRAALDGAEPLSAWPELDDPALRASVAHGSEVPDADVTARLAALRLIDAGVRKRAIDSGDGTLDAFMVDLVHDVYTRSWGEPLVAMMSTMGAASAEQRAQRSAWYQARDDAYGDEHPLEYRRISGLIDLAHTHVTARSLGATGTESLPGGIAQQDAKNLHASGRVDEPGQQYVQLAAEGDERPVLDWVLLEQLLDEFATKLRTMRGRLDYLLEKHDGLIVAKQQRASLMLSLRVDGGTVGVFSELPLGKRHLAKVEAKDADRRRLRLTTGSGSWIAQVGRRLNER